MESACRTRVIVCADSITSTPSSLLVTVIASNEREGCSGSNSNTVDRLNLENQTIVEGRFRFGFFTRVAITESSPSFEEGPSPLSSAPRSLPDTVSPGDGGVRSPWTMGSIGYDSSALKICTLPRPLIKPEIFIRDPFKGGGSAGRLSRRNDQTEPSRELGGETRWSSS
ncbi:hypothetical protein BD779DRAFT_1563724 [Infundibulicybe gibba]|nr:hypothetical protein BD779DRAFT_1563724 [Infundibulicybe gibba]